MSDLCEPDNDRVIPVEKHLKDCEDFLRKLIDGGGCLYGHSFGLNFCNFYIHVQGICDHIVVDINGKKEIVTKTGESELAIKLLREYVAEFGFSPVKFTKFMADIVSEAIRKYPL